MIVVTGGAGFIGSALVSALNNLGEHNILIVDELDTSDKWKNLRGKRFADYLHKDSFLKALLERSLPSSISTIVHMGACSRTTERDVEFLIRNNYHYSCALAEYSVQNKIRFVYASSAATYGDGSLGFDDDQDKLCDLKPLNPYGFSKQIFDLWVSQRQYLNKCAGVKFFNVFGPNEYHKADMRSVVYKAYHQIKQEKRIQLFRSYDAKYADGGQQRDFVYVKDCVNVLCWLIKNPQINGIFNLGSGRARSWNDLAHAVFAAMNQQPLIEYIDMPEQLRSQYQYFTQAAMGRISQAGYEPALGTLEDGVRDYVQNYLAAPDPYL